MYEIFSDKVTSVLVSQLETIFVGTEPSALYTSKNGGESWQQISALNSLKSSAMWSFPPRPWTSHIRWIELDATSPNHLYVAIEAGALVQSHDGGITWIDKVNEGPFDTHTMFTHKVAPGHLYCAAGDGRQKLLLEHQGKRLKDNRTHHWLRLICDVFQIAT
jgi:photosystem II stability/assembly factor-like uncharacterized protein